MPAIKLDLTNSERLHLLKTVNIQVRQEEASKSGTVKKLETLYAIQNKLKGKGYLNAVTNAK